MEELCPDRSASAVARVSRCEHPTLHFSTESVAPKCQSSFIVRRSLTSPDQGFSSAILLAMMPVFAIFYLLLILPFLPDDGKGRMENILFWPIVAGLTDARFQELGAN